MDDFKKMLAGVDVLGLDRTDLTRALQDHAFRKDQENSMLESQRWMDGAPAREHRRQFEQGVAVAREVGLEQGRNFAEVIRAEVEALEEKAKGEGKTAVVTCDGGFELITVAAFEFPTWNIAIVRGTDSNGNLTHRIVHVEDVRVTGKLMPIAEKRNRIGFRMPDDEPISSPATTAPSAE